MEDQEDPTPPSEGKAAVLPIWVSAEEVAYVERFNSSFSEDYTATPFSEWSGLETTGEGYFKFNQFDMRNTDARMNIEAREQNMAPRGHMRTKA